MTDAIENEDLLPETDMAEADAAELVIMIDRLKAENTELKEQALRYAAEAENVKRRAEREMNDARAYAIQRFSRDLLGVADILQRALNSAPTEITDTAFRTFVDGISMTEKELISAFSRNGVKMIAPLKGDRFDPNLHQAVMEQPSTEVEGGAVIMMMQAGYELFGRVIRPAMVAVAAKTTGGYNGTSAAAPGAGVDTEA